MRLTELIAAAIDLVLPTDCVGCGAPSTSSGVCLDCIAAWRIAPREVRPVPAPEGLPPCLSATEYGGLSRSLVLAYKDGRRGLAAMLGDALAQTVAAGAGRPTLAWPLVLIPVPATAVAIRARHGDHMLRLARRAAVRLRRDGWPVRIMRPLRARRKVDAGHLDRHERARAARQAFVLRASRAVPARTAAADAVVVVLDDVLTTGATVAAVCRRLHAAGAPVAFAATVAATSLRGHGQWQ